jgi:predicted RNA-binding Zn ribbon-like protein
VERWLALELASTIRHGGNGDVIDDLTTTRATTQWVHEHADLIGRFGAALVAEFTIGEELRSEIVEVRGAVRALFARAVSPAPPSPADAGRLMPADRALAHLNAVSARERVAPQAEWPPDGNPSAWLLSVEQDAGVRLPAALARAALDFLCGPQREQLRACAAPRCVRYFVKSHGRQEWCKPSCGNRARAARHYERHRAAPD